MLFVIICTDKPQALEARLAVREQHLAYLAAYTDRIHQAGPLMSPDGRMCGSLLIIDVADYAEAEGFAAGDPYNKADIFESVVIRRYRSVFSNGNRVE